MTPDLEQLKQERREKFFSEHPNWKSYDEPRFLALQKREERNAERIKRIEEIFEMRFKNEMTMVSIAERYGITKQRIYQILDAFF